jgi:hypothetical protein
MERLRCEVVSLIEQLEGTYRQLLASGADQQAARLWRDIETLRRLKAETPKPERKPRARMAREKPDRTVKKWKRLWD